MKSIHATQADERECFIVADDLTGACDSAVAFAGRGLRVEVPIAAGEDAPVQGVCAVSTESRDVAEAVAVERVREAMQRAGDARVVLKKIDSVMRGNTFAEVRAAVESFACDVAVMSAAYPAMGRVVKGGLLQIAGTERSVDLAGGLRSAGVNDFVVVRKGEDAAIREAMQEGRRLVVCDAECDEDLRQTVVAARMAAERVLWIGSGGLASALAGDLPEKKGEPAWEATGGRVLMFAGSDHDVTLKQIAALRRSAAVEEMRVEDACAVPAEAHTVVLKVSRGETTEEQIRRAVERVGSEGIGCCLLTGGDTATLVCRALGVRALRLTEEFAPGLPQGVAVDGILDGVPVVLKSGGFGSEDVLCGMAERFTGRREFA